MWRLVAEHAMHMADPLLFTPTRHFVLQIKSSARPLTPQSGRGRLSRVNQANASV